VSVATDRLTREAAADDIDPCGVLINVPDISIAGDSGPVLPENGSAVRVLLALPDDAHSCPLEAEVEASNASEK
jgi:hypothetical protein